MKDIFERAKQVADIKRGGVDLAKRIIDGDTAAQLELTLNLAPVLGDPSLADALTRRLEEDQKTLIAQKNRVLQIQGELGKITEKVTSGQMLSNEEKKFLKSVTEELGRLKRSL